MSGWNGTRDDGSFDRSEQADDPMVAIGHGLELEEELTLPSPLEVYRTDANEEVERMAAEFERQIEAEAARWRPVIQAGNP